MKIKTIVTGLLLIFVAASIVFLVVNESGSGNVLDEVVEPSKGETAVTEDVITTGSDGRKVIVYYFHGNKRCNTCRTIEAWTEAAIQISFSKELDTGRLEWKIVNVDEPENSHFVEDYELTTRTVVLVDVNQGQEERWKRLDRVWQLVKNKEEFVDYIIENTNTYLAAKDG